MSNSNQKHHIDPEFEDIWNRTGDYKYSFEASNNEAWDRFQLSTKSTPAKQTFSIFRNTALLRAAAAIVLLVIGGWIFWMNSQRNIIDSGTLATANQQVKQITLVDGSTVTLNANSSISFSYTKTSRTIELTGMAHFEVAKNPNAPFVIRSGNNQVTVLGTGFDVKSYNNKPLQVTVNHGKVRVEKRSNQSNTALETVVLTKGMRVTENASPKNKHENYFTVQSNINLDAVKWDQGTLKFNNAPINEVLSAIEELYNVSLEIVGNASKPTSATLTGEFNQNLEVDKVCGVVEAALNVQIAITTR